MGSQRVGDSHGMGPDPSEHFPIDIIPGQCVLWSPWTGRCTEPAEDRYCAGHGPGVRSEDRKRGPQRKDGLARRPNRLDTIARYPR